VARLPLRLIGQAYTSGVG